MRIIRDLTKLDNWVNEQKKDQKTIGFVPTMGALHQGHFSLIDRAVKETNTCICSIFVNPTQFNNEDDLVKYPRTEEQDIEGLRKAGCHAVFIPTVTQIYSEERNDHVQLPLNDLDKVMEGKFRPGHFAGVVQVMQRLLNLVPCDKLFMGQKDYQQVTIIDHMIKSLDLACQLVVCPTLREQDGLAMSSRNARLLPHFREQAGLIYRVLSKSKQWIASKPVLEITRLAMEFLSVSEFKPEYFDIVDGHTLEKISAVSDSSKVVACTAVWAGEVRLIDNMVLLSDD